SPAPAFATPVSSTSSSAPTNPASSPAPPDFPLFTFYFSPFTAAFGRAPHAFLPIRHPRRRWWPRPGDPRRRGSRRGGRDAAVGGRADPRPGARLAPGQQGGRGIEPTGYGLE